MAITGPSSYPPTIAAFLTHWGDVNTELGAGGPLVLPDGTDVAALSALRDQLVAFGSGIQGELNDREIARGTIDGSKSALMSRLGEFNRKVRGFLGKSPFANALPDVPTTNAGEARTLAPLDDMASLWAKINAATIPGFTGPLLLLDGYDVATFGTDLAALRAAYLAYSDADQSLKLERERRNDVQDVAYAALRDYRAAVLGMFAPEHALVASLPALSPAPGSTPQAVILSGQWDDPPGNATLIWTASEDPNLDHYEVRVTFGPTYDTDNDSTLASLPPGTLGHNTLAGLANPGDVASYRVYVVTSTGNEAGSNTLTITRP